MDIQREAMEQRKEEQRMKRERGKEKRVTT